ncbi:hypothetical protein [Streptomyces sp. NPDC006510]|uniref:hypothetical protein n=1 Tax=Streptomyces sp. NPDC006510 TaxID=3155600 RepID=UPI0033B02EBC
MTDDDVGAAEAYTDRPGTRRRRRGPILIAGGFVLVAAVSVVGALGLFAEEGQWLAAS